MQPQAHVETVHIYAVGQGESREYRFTSREYTAKPREPQRGNETTKDTLFISNLHLCKMILWQPHNQ